MNSMNMGGMNPGNPAMGGGMPMMNNGANGVQIRQPDDHEETNYEARLNTYIYSYYMKKKNYELARALKNSKEMFDPPLVHTEGNTNGTDNEDTKDGVNLQRPDDLPIINEESQSTFLYAWFCMFWDIWMAQRKMPRASQNATQFVALSQQNARQREQQQQQMMRAMPNMMPGMDFQAASLMRQNQMLGMNGDMRRGVLQNHLQRATPQQVAQFHQAQQAQAQAQQRQHMMNAQMRRDPSGMNGEGPRTPGGGDHAPSPSKRARLDGAPFPGGQMMPNGRPMPPGMPGQQHMMQPNDPQTAQNAHQILMNNGINPTNLSESQFAAFQQQNPSVQAKSIQVYAQNMTKHQGDRMKNAGGMSDGGSPIMGPGMQMGSAEFFATNPDAAQQMRHAGMLPNGQPNANGSNHALQDYQMQLMLLEQQNKKRLLMARQEQDTITRPEGQPGMPGQAGFGAPGMSPQGSRSGTSPQPGDPARRGTPGKMGQPGMPGSPMPDGRMAGSPAGMNFNNIDPAVYGGQMNGRMQPPSSNPAFNGGQMNPQQMEAMQRAQAGNRMPNGQWQQGPLGQAPMMQAGQPGQPAQMGTPQQRNDMPPPQGVPAAAAANGRPGSPAAPPTPSQPNKANPKTKKDPKAKKPTKKNSTASVAATPAAEGDNPPATPTPSTPITPQHNSSFAQGKNDAAGQAATIPNANAAVPPPIAPQADPNNATPFGGIDTVDTNDFSSLQFSNDLNDPNLLENFDFEQFLQGDAFSFDAGAFDADPGIETGGMENA